MNIAQLVNKTNPIIFDVGCNDGGTTRTFYEMFKNPKVYCFEPDPRAIARFDRTMGAYLYEGVLSDINGLVDFYQSDSNWYRIKGWDLSGSIMAPKDHLKVYTEIIFPSIIQVPSITLDTFMRVYSVGIIDYLHADVQGAELRMIAGGRLAFDDKVRFLYTEYETTPLYAGAPTKEDLKRELPNFEVVEDIGEDRFYGNILLKNKNL